MEKDSADAWWVRDSIICLQAVFFCTVCTAVLLYCGIFVRWNLRCLLYLTYLVYGCIVIPLSRLLCSRLIVVQQNMRATNSNWTSVRPHCYQVQFITWSIIALLPPPSLCCWRVSSRSSSASHHHQHSITVQNQSWLKPPAARRKFIRK